MGNTRFSIWVQGLPLKRGQGVGGHILKFLKPPTFLLYLPSLHPLPHPSPPPHQRKKKSKCINFLYAYPSCLSLDSEEHIRRKMYLGFRQTLTKISPAACIFRSTITISLKRLIGIKSISLIQNSAQHDQKSNMLKSVPPPSPHSLTLCGKPCDMKNFLSDCNGIQIHKHLVRKWTFNQSG